MSEISNLEPGLTVEAHALGADDYTSLRACERAAGAYSLGRIPTFAVNGPEAKSWLNGLLTCDVMAVVPGRAQFGLLLNRLGKIQASLMVVEQQQRLLLGVLWGDAHTVAQELENRLVMEDAELSELDRPWLWTFLLGPDASAAAGAHAGAPWGALQIAGSNAVVAWPSDEAPAWPMLSDAAWTWWRVQYRLPWGGIDFGTAERPHEAALDRKAVSWSKGCYLGQEVVCMQDMRGKVKRAVQALTVDAPSSTLPELPRRVSAQVRTPAQKALGNITSAVFDQRAGKWSLLASLPVVGQSNTEQAFWSPVADQAWPLRPLEAP